MDSEPFNCVVYYTLSIWLVICDLLFGNSIMQVINLYGSSGAGKTTISMGLAYNLKMRKKKVEIVSEFAKTLVFSNCQHLLTNQLYVFSEQLFRMQIMKDKDLDYIITDSPLVLAGFYGQKFNSQGFDSLSKELESLIFSEYNKFDNINFFLNRTVAFDPVGRTQVEDESDKDSLILKAYLNKNSIEYSEHYSNDSLAGYLTHKILTNIK